MIVLIGECPGRESIASRPSLALTGSTGRNLCAIAGWDWLVYLRRTERLNLFLDPQPTWRAREAAGRALGYAEVLEGRDVILLGARVAEAFGLRGLPHFQWRATVNPGTRFALVPHPSGRNRLWNDSRYRERARAFLEDLL